MNTRVTRGTVSRSRVVALLLALCLLPLAQAAEPPACNGSTNQVRLQVQVKGVRKASGNITITVYPDASDRFLAKGGKLARQRVPMAAPITTACFALPAAGFYAVAVYHDANGDHDFNRKFVGLPDEGYGFSRNPVTKLGLPSLSEVRFAAKPGDNPVPIVLTYP